MNYQETLQQRIALIDQLIEYALDAGQYNVAINGHKLAVDLESRIFSEEVERALRVLEEGTRLAAGEVSTENVTFSTAKGLS